MLPRCRCSPSVTFTVAAVDVDWWSCSPAAAVDVMAAELNPE